MREEQNNLKVNALLNIPYSSKEEFYERWVEFLRPFHGMSSVPCKVFATLLCAREQCAKSSNEDSVIDMLLFSDEVQQEVCKKLGIDRARMYCNLSILRKYGVMTENRINSKFIPDVKEENGEYKVLIRFCYKNDNRI